MVKAKPTPREIARVLLSVDVPTFGYEALPKGDAEYQKKQLLENQIFRNILTKLLDQLRAEHGMSMGTLEENSRYRALKDTLLALIEGVSTSTEEEETDDE